MWMKASPWHTLPYRKSSNKRRAYSKTFQIFAALIRERCLFQNLRLIASLATAHKNHLNCLTVAISL